MVSHQSDVGYSLDVAHVDLPLVDQEDLYRR